VRKRKQTRAHATQKQTLCACVNLHRSVAGPRSGFVILLEAGRRDGRPECGRLCLADVAHARVHRRGSVSGRPPCGCVKHRPALQGQEGDRTTQQGRDGGHSGSDVEQRRKASTLILLRVVTTLAEGASSRLLFLTWPHPRRVCLEGVFVGVPPESYRKVSCSATYFHGLRDQFSENKRFRSHFFFPDGTGWHHSEQKWIQICFGLIIVLLCTKVNWYKRGGERRRTTF
jgi:hypothetical protein